MKASSQTLGRAGEAAAQRYVRGLGYTVLAQNVRAHGSSRRRAPGRIVAELDIIARDGEVLVFIEVKTRAGRRCGAPQESITPRKLTQLRLAAEYYLTDHPQRCAAIRFDAICLEACPDGWRLHHIKDIG